MNRWRLSEEVKAKYTPIVQEFIDQVEAVDPETATDYLVKDLSDTELNPSTLSELLDGMGYKKGDMQTNGWQYDFWITFEKNGCRPLSVSGCGYTFELKLTEKEE